MPAYFTYITPECAKDAQRHGLLDDIEKLAEKIEKSQDIGNLYPYPKIFRKKNLGRSYRLIIGEVPYNGEVDATLLIFWHVWPRSSAGYREFIKNSQGFEDEFQRDCKSLSPSIEQIWEEKLRSAPKEILPQELSPRERDFLEGAHYRNDREFHDDWIVLESEEWVKRTDPKEFSNPKNLSTRLFELLNLVTQAYQKAENGDCNTTFLSDNSGIGILYKALCERKLIFLIAPLKLNNGEDKRDLEAKYRNVLLTTDADEIKRNSWRSYPSLVLASEDLWERIQKSEKEANLSLSAEEAEVLRSCWDGRYPLFVNGRPGSGKSTILQFLFAEHLYDYLSLANTLQAPPLYLTYSTDLLEKAQRNVEAILKSNAYHQLRNDSPDFATIDLLLRNTFYTLQDYLYGLLPDNKRETFPKEGYLRFPEFRLWYEKTFGRDASLSDISAELAWHVIRSYIKGLSSDMGEYLEDVEEFKELPGQKSVTADTFQRVSQRIWPRYRKWCQENHYWDDQDLVREILTGWAEKEIVLPEHVAVFCDEAQDFSLNELRFIFRLSLYTRRRMPPYLLKHMPMAFAGDPFQTLNPTGFDWNAIRGNFSITMREVLYSKPAHLPVLQPAELTFNYRSSPDIVQLCNFIHLIRGLVFTKRGLEPQEAWFKHASRTPVYFDVGSDVFQSALRSQEETVIILPCQEGEELEFTKADSFLSTIGIENGVVARNILSPMRAKGLEYNRVVLYKFGEMCLQNYPKLLDLLDKGPNKQLSPEELLPLEYFINRLYVAASRARKRLIIADTPEGLKHFWQKYFEKTDLQRWIDAYRTLDKSNRWRKEHIGKIQAGRLEDWEGDRDDPLKLAKDFEQRGVANKDPFLLQRAASNYRMAGREVGAKRCDALRLELEGKLKEAGEIWQSLGEKEKARKLFWKAKAFDKLATFRDGSLEQRVARLMLSRSEARFERVRSLLDEIEQGFENQYYEPDAIWRSVLSVLYQELLNKGSDDILPPFEWERLWNRAVKLRKKGLLERDEEVIQLHLRATPYPDKLMLLQEYRRASREIVSLYKANQEQPLTDIQVEIVLQALRAEGEVKELEALAKQYPSERNLALVLSYHARHQNDAVHSWAKELLALWEQKANWDAALDFVKGKHVEGLLDKRDAEAVRNYPWEKFSLDVEFIKLLSVSEQLVKANTPEKNQISRYLSETLLQQPDVFLHWLTVQQAGGALERAGKVVDCLAFYEMVFRLYAWPADEESQQFARERWLACKRRQLAITDRDDRKRQIEAEINARAHEWNIDMAHLPEYPNVDVDAKPKPVKPKAETKRSFSPDAPLRTETPHVPGLEKLLKAPHPPVSVPTEKSTVAKPQPELQKASVHIIKLQFEANEQRFTCKLDRSRGKMTLQLYGEMEMVTLLAKGLSIQGSDDAFNAQIETVKHLRSLAEYFIRPWNITCVIRTSRQKRQIVYVNLYLGKKEFELLSLRLTE